jgi:hypothetical protein
MLCVLASNNINKLSMKHNYFFTGEKLTPKNSTIQNILNFSKTLSVIRSGILDEKIILFKN